MVWYGMIWYGMIWYDILHEYLDDYSWFCLILSYSLIVMKILWAYEDLAIPSYTEIRLTYHWSALSTSRVAGSGRKEKNHHLCRGRKRVRFLAKTFRRKNMFDHPFFLEGETCLWVNVFTFLGWRKNVHPFWTSNSGWSFNWFVLPCLCGCWIMFHHTGWVCFRCILLVAAVAVCRLDSKLDGSRCTAPAIALALRCLKLISNHVPTYKVVPPR